MFACAVRGSGETNSARESAEAAPPEETAAANDSLSGLATQWAVGCGISPAEYYADGDAMAFLDGMTPSACLVVRNLELEVILGSVALENSSGLQCDTGSEVISHGARGGSDESGVFVETEIFFRGCDWGMVSDQLRADSSVVLTWRLQEADIVDGEEAAGTVASYGLGSEGSMTLLVDLLE
jgi:hypothetical protein